MAMLRIPEICFAKDRISTLSKAVQQRAGRESERLKRVERGR
jgi:hypothetical protein